MLPIQFIQLTLHILYLALLYAELLLERVQLSVAVTDCNLSLFVIFLYKFS